jgi:hypothetical protein
MADWWTQVYIIHIYNIYFYKTYINTCWQKITLDQS